MDPAPSNPAATPAAQPPAPARNMPGNGTPAQTVASSAPAQLNAALTPQQSAQPAPRNGVALLQPPIAVPAPPEGSWAAQACGLIAWGSNRDAAEIRQLKGTLAAKEAENAGLVRDLGRANAAATAAKNDKIKAEASNVSLESKVRKLESTVGKLETKVQEGEKAASAAKAESEKAKAESDKAKAELHKANVEASEAKAETAALRSEKDELLKLLGPLAAAYNRIQRRPAALPATPPADPATPAASPAPAGRGAATATPASEGVRTALETFDRLRAAPNKRPAQLARVSGRAVVSDSEDSDDEGPRKKANTGGAGKK